MEKEVYSLGLLLDEEVEKLINEAEHKSISNESRSAAAGGAAGAGAGAGGAAGSAASK